MNAVTPNAIDGLHWNDDGYATLSGRLLECARRLDAVFGSWASDLDATDYRFPSMIPVRDLAPIAYLRSFPHLATFVTSADRRETSLRTVAAECGTADRIDTQGVPLEPVEQLLTPAACYHFYPQWAGSDLHETRHATTSTECHRREDHYLPLQRQWCFRMREIVCIGDGGEVGRFIGDIRLRIDTLIARLGLDAKWTPASDPFFDPDTDPKAMTQILEPTKLELRTQGGLAIASINRHRSFFGECYRIRYRGLPAHSACVAFGIERWLYALLEVHGQDAATWPIAEESP